MYLVVHLGRSAVAPLEPSRTTGIGFPPGSRTYTATNSCGPQVSLGGVALLIATWVPEQTIASAAKVPWLGSAALRRRRRRTRILVFRGPISDSPTATLIAAPPLVLAWFKPGRHIASLLHRRMVGALAVAGCSYTLPTQSLCRRRRNPGRMAEPARDERWRHSNACRQDHISQIKRRMLVAASVRHGSRRPEIRQASQWTIFRMQPDHT